MTIRNNPGMSRSEDREAFIDQVSAPKRRPMTAYVTAAVHRQLKVIAA